MTTILDPTAAMGSLFAQAPVVAASASATTDVSQSERPAQQDRPLNLAADTGALPTDAFIAVRAPSTQALSVPGVDAGTLAALGMTALAHNPLALLEGLSGLGSALPLVRIEYCASEEAKADGLIKGQWTHTLSGEQKSTLDIVIVATLPEPPPRRYLAKYAPGDTRPPICHSVDGVTGSGSARYDEHKDTKTPVRIEAGRRCDGCEFGKWTKDAEGNNVRRCPPIFVLLAHEASWGPVVIELKKTSEKPLKTFYRRLPAQLMALKAQRAREGKPEMPANWIGRFDLSTRAEGIYFLPEFGTIRPCSDERIRDVAESAPMIAELRKQLRTGEVVIESHDDEPDAGATTGASTTGGFSSQFASSAFASTFTR